MPQKRNDEYYAKVLLEQCFPNRFFDLVIEDKPDLRDKLHTFGIEVSNAEPQRFLKNDSDWRKVLRSRNEQERKKNIAKFEKSGLKFQERLQDMGGAYTRELVSSIKAVFDKKLKKLQNDDFNKFNQNGLIILTETSFGSEDLDYPNQPEDYLDYMVNKNKKEKYKFDYVFYRLLDCVCEFDLANCCYKIQKYDDDVIKKITYRLLGSLT